MHSPCGLVGACGIGDVTSDANALIAANTVKKEAFVTSLKAAIRAYGYTPTVSTTQSGGNIYVAWTDYVIGIAEFPDYPGHYIGIDDTDDDPATVAAGMISEGKRIAGTPGSTSQTTGDSITPSLSFSNTTTGNRSVLRVGDAWTLSVTGAPNSDVLAIGGPGGRRDQTVMGRTNSSGVWTTSGRMSAAEIGDWSQEYLVGGRSAGSINFEVVAVSSSRPPADTSTSTTDGDKTVVDKIVDEVQKETEGGFSVPSWVWLAGGAGVLFFMMKGNK